MRAKRGRPEHSFTDIHHISGFIEKRLGQLPSDDPVGTSLRLGRPERAAILEFVQARRAEVSEIRVRTFLSWLPLSASRLGPRFLVPDRDTPNAFNGAFPSRTYARGTRATGAN